MRQDTSQRQIGKLALSQKMRLSLEVLRMDAGRLRRRLRLELARNPALSCADPELLAQSQDARAALIAQIGLLRLPDGQLRIARELAHCLDDRGLLADPLAEIAGWLGTTPAVLQDLLPHLQQLDPPGVFARDIGECFRLQLQARNRLDPWMDRLLDRLDLVAAEDLSAIAGFLGTDHEDARDMIADIRALTPAPLGTVTQDAPPPELELTVQGVLRPGPMLALGMTEVADADARAAPRDLMAAVDSRAQTLLRIGTALVERQRPRLLGQGPLRPLTMTALGAALGLSKSTISRAIAGVVMRTPAGLVRLRDLVRSAPNAQNPDLDRDRVLWILSRIIATFGPQGNAARMSVWQMSLRRAGIRISRRTVAKYRLELAAGGQNSDPPSPAAPAQDRFHP